MLPKNRYPVTPSTARITGKLASGGEFSAFHRKLASTVKQLKIVSGSTGHEVPIYVVRTEAIGILHLHNKRQRSRFRACLPYHVVLVQSRLPPSRNYNMYLYNDLRAQATNTVATTLLLEVPAERGKVTP